MIVPMKKLTLLIYHKEKGKFLSSLQEKGVIHISESGENENAEVLSENYKEARALSKRCDAALANLKKIEKENENVPKRDIKAVDALKALDEYESIENKLDSLLQQAADLEKDKSLLEPWGDFNPEIIEELGKRGINSMFLEIPAKKYSEGFFSDYAFSVISGEGSDILAVLFYEGEKPVFKEAQEASVPVKSLSEINKELDEKKKETESLTEKRNSFVSAIPDIIKLKAENDNLSSFADAEISMREEAEGTVSCLEGWLPAEKEKEVSSFLTGFTGYFSFREPTEEDDVPVLMRNGKFASLFEPITKIRSLPSYREVDPTPFFAPFFALYFGLCLGDLGYGLLTFAVSVIAYKKGPVQFRNYFTVGMILGGITMLSGLFLNSFFGQNIFMLKGNPDYMIDSSIGSKIAFLGSYKDLKAFPAMGFSVVLGFIQVLLGVALKCYNNYKQKGWLWFIDPAGTFLMILGLLVMISKGSPEEGFKGVTGIDISTYELGALSIGAWVSAPPVWAGQLLLFGGLFMLLFFNSPEKKIFIRPLTGLWELYNFSTGIVGDILSYLRIFALGLASGLLASAFNGIALGFIDGGLFPGILMTVPLLLFAHTLNFGLALLGAFVHPLRLTFVEFYKNLDFEGGGSEYSPFTLQKV
ncbi:MAG: V-type ATP synthase subunit I [Fibrobacterota bacterium]